MTALLALAVPAEALAAVEWAGGGKVVVSAGALSALNATTQGDPDALAHAAAQLARLVVDGKYQRQRLAYDAEKVDVGPTAFVLLARTDEDGAPAFVIVSPIEIALAGTVAVTLDVRERVLPGPGDLQ